MRSIVFLLLSAGMLFSCAGVRNASSFPRVKKRLSPSEKKTRPPADVLVKKPKKVKRAGEKKRPAGLLSKINEAKIMLEPVRLKKKWARNGVLAIYDGRNIKTVRIKEWKAPAYEFNVLRENGINSNIKVEKPAGAMVLALKARSSPENCYTVKKKVKARECRMVRRRHRRKARRICRMVKAIKTIRSCVRLPPRDIIYAPYSEALHTPEVIKAGHDYTDRLISEAAAELNKQRVMSRSFSGKLVTEVVPARVMKAIILIEHITPDEFYRVGIRKVAEKVLVTLALNHSSAYAHSVSCANARGLVQFIRSTYLVTARRYPEADLIYDFERGTEIHHNAVMAQYCYIDWILSYLDKKDIAAMSAVELGAFIAASYNGGEVRAAKAYYRNKRRWKKLGYGLAKQTTIYVEEFIEAYGFLKKR